MKITVIVLVLFLVGCAGSLFAPAPRGTGSEEGEIIAPLDYKTVLVDAAKTGADAALEVVRATPAGQAGVEAGSAILKLLVALGIVGTGVQTVRRNREAGNATSLAAGVRAIETAVYASDTEKVKTNIRVNGTAGLVDKARALANNHYGG